LSSSASSEALLDEPGADRRLVVAHEAASPAEGPQAPGGWEVRMYDTARELSAQLDSKMSALRALAAEADRAAARLEAALERSDGFGPLRGHQAQSLAAAGESRRDSLLTDVAPRAHRREEVYTLADYGYAPAEIARRLGTPVGEVELILSLRKKWTSRAPVRTGWPLSESFAIGTTRRENPHGPKSGHAYCPYFFAALTRANRFSYGTSGAITCVGDR